MKNREEKETGKGSKVKVKPPAPAEILTMRRWFSQAVSGGFQYEELAYPVSVGRLSEPIATGDGSSSFITLNRFTHQHDATLQSPNTTPDSSSSRQPVQVNDDSSRRSSCMTALQHQVYACEALNTYL